MGVPFGELLGSWEAVGSDLSGALPTAKEFPLFPPALPLTLAVGSWEESSQLPTAYPSPTFPTELGLGLVGNGVPN